MTLHELFKVRGKNRNSGKVGDFKSSYPKFKIRRKENGMEWNVHFLAKWIEEWVFPCGMEWSFQKGCIKQRNGMEVGMSFHSPAY